MATEKLRYLVTADTKGFAKGMAAVAALAAAAFTAVVKVTADFEKQLSKLRAVSGANDKQMGELEKKARDLGKTTAFTASEVAKLQFELAKLGFSSDEILNASGGVLDLAAGLGVELADAAKLTGSTMRAFGLDSSDTTRIVDVLAKAAATSALDFTKMTESLKYAAPLARAAGVSLEQVTGILATLANNGIHGSQAGTGLSKVFVKVAASGRSLGDMLQEINDSINPLATATKLFGERANKVALIMASQATPAISNFNGAAETQRKIMEDNLIGDWDKLKSAITEMGISLGKTTTGPLRDFTQWITEVINGTDTALGLLDSLARIFLFMEETVLLAFAAVEEFWITIQMIATSNPFTGQGGIASPESYKRLTAIRDRLSDINAEIIKISDYGGVKKDETKKTKPKDPTDPVKPKASMQGYADSFGFAQFFQPQAIDSALGNVKGFVTKVESQLTKLSTSTKVKTDEVKDTLISGWGIAASAIGSMLGKALAGEDMQNFGKELLGMLGQILIMIGGAVIAAGTALTIFGIGIPAIAAGSIAIGVGSALVAFAGSGGGASVGSGGGTSSRSTPTPSTMTPQSMQGDGSGQGGWRLDGQDLIFAIDAARSDRAAYS